MAPAPRRPRSTKFENAPGAGDTFPDILGVCGMICVSLELVTMIPALTLLIPNAIFG